jgi:hypothetical protein
MWLLSNMLIGIMIVFCGNYLGLALQQRLFGVISRNLTSKHADRISFIVAFALTWIGACVVLFITEKRPDEWEYHPHFVGPRTRSVDFRPNFRT